MVSWEKLCPQEEVPPGGRKLIPVGVWNILVFNAGKRLYACAAECPHLGESLEKAELRGHVVRCSAHGYEMDLANGKCLTEAGVTIPVFQTELRDGWIWIKV